ncbi:MAG: SpoIID/LytB domain-containing protein [bacterium]|nr:MAG: SpoIID/LytB domain-containing protein [bacterium]
MRVGRSRPSLHPVALAAGLFLAGVTAAASPTDGRASAPEIRVLIAQGEKHSIVRGDDLTVEVETQGGFRKIINRLRGVSFSYSEGRMRLDGSDIRGGRFAVGSSSGLFNYDGTLMRGRELKRGKVILTALPDGIAVVNAIPLESYLVGLVNGEIDSGWPMEAVKAQVIAARTYALLRMAAGGGVYDVRDDVEDQVYLGPGGEDERAAAAVRQTRGKALFRAGELVPAFFHSSCGGRTADAGEIWGAPHPALVSVECSDCEGSPRSRWDLVLDRVDLQGVLDALFPGSGDIRTLGIQERTGSGRVKTLFFATGEGRTLVDGEDFRKEVGYRRLPSTRFTVSGYEGKVLFRGRGYGHGIGLCQWGAKGAAERGMDHEQILRRYYRGVTIRRAY